MRSRRRIALTRAEPRVPRTRSGRPARRVRAVHWGVRGAQYCGQAGVFDRAGQWCGRSGAVSSAGGGDRGCLRTGGEHGYGADRVDDQPRNGHGGGHAVLCDQSVGCGGGGGAFTGCAINKAGTGYKFTATTDGLAVTSTALNVGAGLPTRIFGVDAIATAIAVSQAGFPKAGSAAAVVLARSDFFSDALAGGPLAAKVGGPLLITPGTPLSASLDPRVLAEFSGCCPTGKTVYILGGPAALSSNIDTTLTNAGYVVGAGPGRQPVRDRGGDRQPAREPLHGL